MLKVKISMCVHSNAESIWKVLADLPSIQHWSSDVKTATTPSNHDRGIDACRVCTLRNGLEIHEEFTEWVEGRRYTYRGTGIPGAVYALNTWSVEPDGDACILSSDSTLVMKYGILGWALERMLYPLIVYKGKQALRSIAFMAINGRPIDRSSDRLPGFAATC